MQTALLPLRVGWWCRCRCRCVSGGSVSSHGPECESLRWMMLSSASSHSCQRNSVSVTHANYTHGQSTNHDCCFPPPRFPPAPARLTELAIQQPSLLPTSSTSAHLLTLCLSAIRIAHSSWRCYTASLIAVRGVVRPSIHPSIHPSVHSPLHRRCRGATLHCSSFCRCWPLHYALLPLRRSWLLDLLMAASAAGT